MRSKKRTFRGAEQDGFVGIVGVDYELGESCTMSDPSRSVDVPNDIAAHDESSSASLNRFRIVTGDLFDTAIASARRTIEQTALDPADIDALMLCSSTVSRMIDGDRHRVAYFLEKAGITRAYPIGVTFATCANFPTSLSLAASLIRQRIFENVLLVTLDAYSPECPTAVAQNGRLSASYVCSDGAASCLVTADRRASYELLGVTLGTNQSLFTPGNREEQIIAYLDLLRKTCQTAFRECNVSRSDIRQFFFGNYIAALIDSFGRALGLSLNQVFRENIWKLGHCYAADNLINLKDYSARWISEPGDCFALISTGIGQMGTSIIRRM